MGQAYSVKIKFCCRHLRSLPCFIKAHFITYAFYRSKRFNSRPEKYKLLLRMSLQERVFCGIFIYKQLFVKCAQFFWISWLFCFDRDLFLWEILEQKLHTYITTLFSNIITCSKIELTKLVCLINRIVWKRFPLKKRKKWCFGNSLYLQAAFPKRKFDRSFSTNLERLNICRLCHIFTFKMSSMSFNQNKIYLVKNWWSHAIASKISFVRALDVCSYGWLSRDWKSCPSNIRFLSVEEVESFNSGISDTQTNSTSRFWPTSLTRLSSECRAEFAELHCGAFKWQVHSIRNWWWYYMLSQPMSTYKPFNLGCLAIQWSVQSIVAELFCHQHHL